MLWVSCCAFLFCVRIFAVVFCSPNLVEGWIGGWFRDGERPQGGFSKISVFRFRSGAGRDGTALVRMRSGRRVDVQRAVVQGSHCSEGKSSLILCPEPGENVFSSPVCVIAHITLHRLLGYEGRETDTRRGAGRR